MKKITIRLFIILVLFFAAWYLLKQLNWVDLLRIRQLSKTTEEKLGDLLWEIQRFDEKEIRDTEVIHYLDSILFRICKANDIRRSDIKLHVIRSEEINAFAMPNRHLIVNSQLILDCENPEELSGVLAHEIAHIELNHVMKKLMEEVGISALMSVTNGKDITIAKNIARTLSSAAYSRSIEQEADIKAVDYLIGSDIHPQYLANFLFRLSGSTSSAAKYLTWISSHPGSEERAAYLVESIRARSIRDRPVLSTSAWNKLKAEVKE